MLPPSKLRRAKLLLCAGLLLSAVLLSAAASAQSPSCLPGDGFCNVIELEDPGAFLSTLPLLSPAVEHEIIVTGPGFGSDVFSRFGIPDRPGLEQLTNAAKRIVASQLGSEVDADFLHAARGQIKALVFIRLLAIIDKAADERTPEEQLVHSEIQQLMKDRRADIANRAKQEWTRWFENPCGYTVPVGDDPDAYLNQDAVVDYCLVVESGNPFAILLTPAAIPAGDFLAWANQLRAEALMDHWVETQCFADTDCSEDPDVRADFEDAVRRQLVHSIAETDRSMAYHHAMGELAAIPAFSFDDALAVNPSIAAGLRDALDDFHASYFRDWLGAYLLGMLVAGGGGIPIELHDTAVLFTTGMTLTILEILDHQDSEAGVDFAVASIDDSLEEIVATELGTGELFIALMELSVPETLRQIGLSGADSLVPGAFSAELDGPPVDTLDVRDWGRSLVLDGVENPVRVGFSESGWLTREGLTDFPAAFLHDGLTSHLPFVDAGGDYKIAWMVKGSDGHSREFLVTPYAELIGSPSQPARVSVVELLNNDCPQAGGYQTPPLERGLRCVHSFGENITADLAPGDAVVIAGQVATVHAVISASAFTTVLPLEARVLVPIHKVDMSSAGVLPGDGFDTHVGRATFLANSPPVAAPTTPDFGLTGASPTVSGADVLLEFLSEEEGRLGFPQGAELTLLANANDDAGPLQYRWDIETPIPDDLPDWKLIFTDTRITSTAASVTHVFPWDGDYPVKLTVTDQEGASLERELLVTILDTKNLPPEITPTLDSAFEETNGWYRGDVALSWYVADAYFLPGQNVNTANFMCGDSLVTGNGSSSFTCEAYGFGGYASRTATIRRDDLAPVVTAGFSPAPNAAGWFDGPVTISYACSDAHSGVAQPSGCDDRVIAEDGVHSLPPLQVGDLAGNLSAALVYQLPGGGVISSLPLDQTAPSIDSAVAELGADRFLVSFSCADALSGVASCEDSREVGAAELLASFAGSAVDVAGNLASVTVGDNEVDRDADDVGNEIDNCPGVFNRDQLDADGDGSGDRCDPDIDGDDVENGLDECSGTPLGGVVGAQGCSLDQLAPCEGPRDGSGAWKSRGEYLRTLGKHLAEFRELGLIDQTAVRETRKAAQRSACGG